MSDQALFRFASMTAAEIQDERDQLPLPIVEEKPKGKAITVSEREAIRLADCPSCGGSTFDDGERPLICHCGATIPE